MATTGASLDNIYSRLSSAPEYHPFNADTFSDWSMEAGDMIRISRDGKNYDSPVHNATMSWKGQSQISVSSDGNEKRESIAKATKKKYSRGGSGYRNDNSLYREIWNSYNGLSGFFEVTTSRMYAEFKGDYDGLAGLFEVTRSRMGAEFMDAYNGLAGAFEVTAGHMAAAFLDSYNGLAGAFEVTASQMAAEFRGKYDGLVGRFEVTRSQMAADFYGAYDGLKGSFNVTRSQMAADFSSAYDGLVGHFETTRSLFNVALQDSYQQLTSGFQAAANYTMMYTQGRTSRAYIMTQINSNTGQTEALINADQILIGTSGNAKVNLANVITLGDSSTVLIKKNVTVNETYGANGVNLMTDGTIRGHQLTLIKTGGQEGQYAVKSITSDDIDEMVVKAAIDGNTLRLWKRGANLEATSGDGIINFSKAVTLSGAWANGDFPLTINATQTNNGVTSNVGSKSVGFTNASDFYFTVEKNGDPTAFGSSKKLINVPFKIVHHAGDPVGDQIRYSSSLASVDATSVYNNGWEDNYDEIGLNYSSDQELSGSRKNITIYPVGKASPSADAASIISKGITVTVPYEDTYWMVNNINRTAPDGYTKVVSGGQVYYTADNTSGANKGLRVYMAPKITVDGIEFNTDSAHQVYFSALPTRIWADAYAAGAAAATVVVTAGTSAITWDSTNKKFYNYGYAYVNGGSEPEATSTKRESSVVSLDTSASWSNGAKSIVVKHGTTNILADSVSIPATSGTTWENPTGNYWRARLTIGGVYRYSDTHVFYTQAQYNSALASVPSGYEAISSVTIAPSSDVSLYPGGSQTVAAKKNGNTVSSITVTAKNIRKITLDSAGNHLGSWYNYIVYFTDDTSMAGYTDGSSVGLYLGSTTPSGGGGQTLTWTVDGFAYSSSDPGNPWVRIGSVNKNYEWVRFKVTVNGEVHYYKIRIMQS